MPFTNILVVEYPVYYNYMPQVILNGLIIAAALHYFNMESEDDDMPPQVTSDP